MILRFDTFDGEVPRVPANKLPLTSAKRSLNTAPTREALSPSFKPFVQSNAGVLPQTVWSQTGVDGYAWTFDTTVAESPYPGDVHKRLYFIQDNELRVCRSDGATTAFLPPSTSYKVGVPAPTIAVTAAKLESFTLNPTDVVSGELFWATTQGELLVRALSRDEVSQMLSSAGCAISNPPPPVSTRPSTFREFIVGPQGQKELREVPGVTTDIRKSQALQVRVKVVRDGNTVVDVNTVSFSPSAWSLRTSVVSKEVTSFAIVYDGAGSDAAAVETRAYFATCVNSYGEESAPSKPVVVDVPSGIAPVVVITMPNTAGMVPVLKARIYRTDANGVARVVKDVPTTALTFNDNVSAVALGETMNDFGGLPPLMQGVVNGHARFLIGWQGATLFFSTDGGHSWDPDRRIELKHHIVAVHPQGGSYIVLTKGRPYVLSGNDSRSMGATPIAADYPATSAKATCMLGGAVAYASPVGIVLVEGGTVRADYSASIFTDTQWAQEFGQHLNQMVLVAHKQSLLVLCPNTDGFIVSPDSQGIRRHKQRAQCAAFIPGLGTALAAQGTSLVKWEGGATESMSWSSAERDLPYPGAFGVGQIEVERGVVKVDVFADGVRTHTEQFAAGISTFRMTTDIAARRWGATVSGTGEMRSLILAQSAKELAQV